MLHDGIALVGGAFGIPLPFDTPSPVYVLLEAGGAIDPTDELADAVAGVDGVVDVAVAERHARGAPRCGGCAKSTRSPSTRSACRTSST